LAQSVMVSILASILSGGLLTAAELPSSPGSVIARYTAARSLDCGEVAVDIEASLPKLAKRGRLQAVRHWAPAGKPEYEMVAFEGDHTVKQQVIARYLSAELQAAELPSPAVAMSPQNYKFRYVGSIGAAPSLTYVFQITPRRKGPGLIQGELWIDVASGIAVRKAGHLVRKPSVLLRAIDVIQDTYIREGDAYLRITHLDIDMRLAGRAELTIRERPCLGVERGQP